MAIETGIKVEGTNPEPDALKALTDGITAIFRVAAETRMEQETVRDALNHLGHAGSVHGATISGANIHGGKTVHVHVDADSLTD